MREIVFDTETTGFDPDSGDKIVEIGMIELIDFIPTGKTFHRYINPMRDVPLAAYNVHGLSAKFLESYPIFGDSEICDEMLDFIEDSKLIAHNAEFDRKFLNAELKAIGKPIIEFERCIDTVVLARKKFPGAPNTLDALCKRFAIDLKERDKHGALIDSKLLAAVYLELMGGRERSFGFEGDNNSSHSNSNEKIIFKPARQRPNPLISRLSEDEIASHDAFVKTLGDKAFWNKEQV